MPSENVNRGAKRAREARAHWGLPGDAPLPCVVTVAEHCARLPVLVAALPLELAGALDPRGLVWVNGAHAAVRRRFTVAHELGHHRLGHERPTVDTVADLGERHDPHEVQANAFAAELLAPEGLVRANAGDPVTLEDVVRLAATSGMSARAASYRFTTLGLVSDRRAQQLHDEIDAGLHVRLAQELGLAGPEDLLGALQAGDLPRLPPALRGSVLDAAVRGSLDAGDAALVAGVTPEALAGGLDAITS